MKKTITLMMALLVALGLTQCKKSEQPTTDNTENTFNITLSLKNSGAKVDVTPTEGTVVFEAGDKIYVGSGGKYVGSLIHNGNHQFVGSITNPVEGEPLQFFFLGNVIPEETLSAGATEEFSVIISDQTEHLPVISCAASEQDFSLTNETYTAHLLNKCALAKFLVTTPANTPANVRVCITGLNNKVTVNFTDYSLTSSQDGEGVIILPAGIGQDVEQWAILLPQNAIEEGEEGSVYTLGGNYLGTRPAIPAIIENGYLTDGIAVSTNIQVRPWGTLNGKFTINAAGTQVFFAQGNLQYIGSAATPYWQFAEHQWDYLGNNGQGSNSQTADRDLFGWGTSGYNHGATYYQPWVTSTTNSSYYAYGNQYYNLSAQNGQADWGYNAIANGGNEENSGWRTLTTDEWGYIFSSRTDAASKYGHGKVNGVNGMILLPDEWTLPEGLNFTSDISSWVNVYNAEQWAQMMTNGAVFLPAAGYRYSMGINDVGNSGSYWSSSHSTDDNTLARYVYFKSDRLNPQHNSNRGYGYSVRLVRNAQ